MFKAMLAMCFVGSAMVLFCNSSTKEPMEVIPVDDVGFRVDKHAELDIFDFRIDSFELRNQRLFANLRLTYVPRESGVENRERNKVLVYSDGLPWSSRHLPLFEIYNIPTKYSLLGGSPGINASFPPVAGELIELRPGVSVTGEMDLSLFFNPSVLEIPSSELKVLSEKIG